MDSPRARARHLSSFQRGRRVLVVENDYILAENLRAELERHGAEVLGPAASVAAALELIRTGPAPDAAILDINLDDEAVYPVADVLESRGIPFVFATSQQPLAIPHVYAQVPRAEKPVVMPRLAQVLAG